MTTKKIICGIAVLAIAAVAAVNVTKSNTRTTAMTDIQLANVEALASESSGTSHTLTCGPSGIKMCKATCSVHQVTIEAWGNGSPATLTCN